MRSALLRRLIESHLARDDATFRRLALQLAATEEQAGHSRVADEIRESLAEVQEAPPPALGQVVDMGRPRRELTGLLAGSYRPERLSEVVLTDEARLKLDRALREFGKRQELENWGLAPARKLLFHGPPGCGKTITASAVAGELGLSLMTVRFDALFSRYLGETASHLATIFEEMRRRPAVYLFDECDAIGQSRSEGSDIGEVRRVVTSFLQLLDSDDSPSIVIAATNFEGTLDRALFRRFDLILQFPTPSKAAIEILFHLRLARFRFSKAALARLSTKALGLTFADVARAIDQSLKGMVLDHRDDLREDDVGTSIAEARHRRMDPA